MKPVFYLTNSSGEPADGLTDEQIKSLPYDIGFPFDAGFGFVFSGLEVELPAEVVGAYYVEYEGVRYAAWTLEVPYEDPYWHAGTEGPPVFADRDAVSAALFKHICKMSGRLWATERMIDPHEEMPGRFAVTVLIPPETPDMVNRIRHIVR